MKYYFLFISLLCVSFLEAQRRSSRDTCSYPSFEILERVNGICTVRVYGDTVSYSKPISRKELRSSRDIFFYQRGDTVYSLYDPTDTLQYMDPGQSVYWYSRPLTPSEKDYDILDEEHDRNLYISFHFDLKVSLKVVSEEFVKHKRAVTREELLAFFHREKRRRQEAYKRTGNSTYDSYYFDNCTYRYFSVEFVFVPIGNGKYELYKVRP